MENNHMTASDTWMIETHNVTRSYGNVEKIYALDGVSLHVAPGELVAIMGPSGSGKSTLLNILGALDQPTSGEVFVNGQNLTKIKNSDDFRAKTVGFIFQLHNLLPTMTAKENIEIPMVGQLSPRARNERSRELLKMVGLEDRMDHLPGQLSGGQRQRVAIARCLANNPPLILADEPTGALDSVNGQEVMQLLRDLNQSRGTTFVVVTHDLSVARQTRRIIFMQDGKIVREDRIGTPLEEDLKLWRRTRLGQHVLQNDPETLQALDLTEQEASLLREVILKTGSTNGTPAEKDDPQEE
jgi:ABC-type lipoprotein export system ATPase subunit